MRQDIPVEYRDGRSSYRTTFGPLYLQFTDLLLRRAAADQAAATALIREARDTVEALKETELQDYFRDPCVASFLAKQRSIAAVAAGVAVIYPISLPDRLEILVSFGNEERQFTIPVPEAALREEVQHFRALLGKANDERVPCAGAAALRPDHPPDRPGACGPSCGHARRRSRRGAADRPVCRAQRRHGVSRRALRDRDRARVSSSSSPSRSPPPRARRLSSGFRTASRAMFRCQTCRAKSAAVHAIEGGDVLLNSDFTRSQFANELKSGRYSIVHIASHGQFGSDPSQTFVLAFDGKLTMDDLEADIKYGPPRATPLELLILSACETASGDDRAALGLAGVALKAGARSALATLWYINDIASGELIRRFYLGLQSGPVESASVAPSAADAGGRPALRPSGLLGAVPADRQLALSGTAVLGRPIFSPSSSGRWRRRWLDDRGRAADRSRSGGLPATGRGTAGLSAAATRRSGRTRRRRVARHVPAGGAAAGDRGSSRPATIPG